MMRTLRTSTNVRVLPGNCLLYYRRCLLALLSFVWFALFSAPVALVAFYPSVFSLSSLMLCTLFFLFFLLFMSSGKEEGTLFLSVVVASLPFVVPSVLGVLLVMYL